MKKKIVLIVLLNTILSIDLLIARPNAADKTNNKSKFVNAVKKIKKKIRDKNNQAFTQTAHQSNSTVKSIATTNVNALKQGTLTNQQIKTDIASNPSKTQNNKTMNVAQTQNNTAINSAQTPKNTSINSVPIQNNTAINSTQIQSNPINQTQIASNNNSIEHNTLDKLVANDDDNIITITTIENNNKANHSNISSILYTKKFLKDPNNKTFGAETPMDFLETKELQEIIKKDSKSIFFFDIDDTIIHPKNLQNAHYVSFRSIKPITISNHNITNMGEFLEYLVEQNIPFFFITGRGSFSNSNYFYDYQMKCGNKGRDEVVAFAIMNAVFAMIDLYNAYYNHRTGKKELALNYNCNIKNNHANNSEFAEIKKLMHSLISDSKFQYNEYGDVINQHDLMNKCFSALCNSSLVLNNDKLNGKNLNQNGHNFLSFVDFIKRFTTNTYQSQLSSIFSFNHKDSKFKLLMNNLMCTNNFDKAMGIEYILRGIANKNNNQIPFSTVVFIDDKLKYVNQIIDLSLGANTLSSLQQFIINNDMKFIAIHRPYSDQDFVLSYNYDRHAKCYISCPSEIKSDTQNNNHIGIQEQTQNNSAKQF